MKALSLFTYLIFVTSMIGVTWGRRLLPTSKRRLLPRNLKISDILERDNNKDQNLDIQISIAQDKQSPNMVLPPGSHEDSSGDGTNGDVMVSDILSKTREINIFASLTRDIESVSKRLDNGSRNTTVLAPANTAIQRLPRKPWENPEDYNRLGEEQAYSGSEGEGRAARNLKRFVEAHVVPQSPWLPNEPAETLGGGNIYWEEGSDGKTYIQPGNIEVDRMDNRVSNGEVWILKDVINYL